MAGTNPDGVEVKRRAFVEHYLANGHNATQAAIAAGFSPRTAKQAGSRMLSRVDVKALIAARTEKALSELALTTDGVLREVARIVHFDPRKLFHEDGSTKAVHELDADTAGAIASVEVEEIGREGTVIGHTKKFKAWDKNSALDKAMKYLGLLKQGDAPAPGPVINAQNVVVMNPMEAYRRLIGAAPKG